MEIFDEKDVKASYLSQHDSIHVQWYNLFTDRKDTNNHIHRVLEEALNVAKLKKPTGWIVNMSEAKGVLRNEDLEYVNNDWFPRCANAGVKKMVTISSKVSPINNMGNRKWQEGGSVSGIRMADVNTMADALEWLANG